MATTYDEIRDRFLSLITDFDLISLTDEEINEIVDGYMKSGIARFHDCVQDLSDRDDDFREFNMELSPLEIEILSQYMVLAWLSPQTRHQQKLQINIGTRDYSTYSPANQLKEMRELEAKAKDDITELCNEYYFRNLID
jgi:hypothetical protein